MINRRVIAVLLSLSLSHLMVVGELTACSDGDGHVAGAPDASAATVHVHDSEPHPESTPAPADAPGRAQCCAAMMSCALTLFAPVGTERADPTVDARAARDVPQRRPDSKVRAPDPPPPKA